MARTKTYSVAILVGLLGAGACSAGADGVSSDGSGTGSGNPGDDGGGGGGSGGGSDDGVLPTYPTEHPRIYLTPNRARLEGALATNTAAATKFRATVDQWVAGADLWGFQSWNAALLGQLTGDAKYCTKAVAVVEAQVTAAEASIAGGTAPEVAGDSYLAIGELVGDLALVYDWCHDTVTANQRTRWLAYANQAIWNVWHPAAAKWGNTMRPWSGWSIDNPSNNYYYSFLRATMLVGLAAKGESPQADEWIAQFRDAKIFGELVPTFTSDLPGGGSREGTGYGVAMRRLFEMYDFWKATTGENLATKTAHARSSMVSFIHQTLPTVDRVAPTGDQSRDATAAFFDYHRNYLQELISIFPDDPLAGRAKSLLAASTVTAMGSSFMFAYDFLYDNSMVTNRALDGMGTAYYAKGIGELYARSGWDKHATWINLIAGPYTETHAHQDQGSIMIFKDGWLAYDPVVETHSGIDQEITTHGLVRIDSGGAPVRQIVGTMSKLQALATGTGWVYASADLTPAYDGNAAVQKVHRELLYLEPDAVIVFDRVQTASGTTQTWQLATPVQPAISGNTATVSNAGHSLKITRIAPSAGGMSTFDYRSNSDFSGGFRLDEQQPGGDNRYLHVLGVDGAITSATASGATGVTVQLIDGRTVTVAFDRDQAGATLTINGVATTLAPGLATLPE
ncbi:MAG: Fibronectin type domain protein [Deltaproteobacteria bacterium]|nr:Fibronectin type domain protein [Deltaproteobacteria bacterium]